MYEALHTRLSIDQAYDLAEIERVSRSWRDAVQANAEITAEQRRRERGV